MTTTSTPLWDVVVVGGGAAGLSAALILARARRRVLVLDSGAPRNRFAPHMHGVLSRDGYPPLDLVADGRREVRRADGVIQTATVVALARHTDGRFELTTESGERHLASRVIVATGIRDELPAIRGLAEQWGRGVVACPYCDGYEARGKRIGVLLGSEAGLHKAQMIRAYSPHVTVLTALAGELSRDDLRGLEARDITVDARRIEAIVSAGDILTGVEFADNEFSSFDAIFAEPRMVALDDLLSQVDVDRSDSPFGPWTATDAMFQTSVPGLFAVGNVANPGALVPVAAAAGVVAATAINASLVAEDVAAALRGIETAGEMERQVAS